MNRIRPTSLTMRNFMSYGNNETTIDLNFIDPTLVLGFNFDDMVNGQVDSNGSGKTTILNAISVVGYDKPISDISKDRLINNINKKDMYLRWEFIKNDNTFYRVERYRKNKAMGGDGVRIFERVGNDDFDASNDVTPDSIGAANALLAKIIGVPFEIFSRIVVFSATHEPFLSMPATHATKPNQRDVIEELFGITELTEKADLLRKKISDNKKRFDELNELNEIIRREHTNRKTLLDSVNLQFVQWNDRKIVDFVRLNSELESLPDVDFATQSKLLQQKAVDMAAFEAVNTAIREANKSYEFLTGVLNSATHWEAARTKNVETLEAKLAAWPEIDYEGQAKLLETVAALKEDIRNTNAAIRELEASILTTTKELDKARMESSHLGESKCPYCSQNYAEAKTKKEAVDIRIDELEKVLNAATKKLVETKQISEEEQDDHRILKGKLTFNSLDEVRVHQKSKENVIIELARVKAETNQIDSEKVKQDLKETKDKIEGDQKKSDKLAKLLTKIDNGLNYPSEASLAAAKNRIDNLKLQIQTLKDSTNPHQKTLDELVKSESSLGTLKDDDINALDDEIEHQNFLLKLLTKKDSFVRKVLLQKNLPFLNGRLKLYLDKLGMNHRVTFVEDLSVKITKFGCETEFGGMSSGQRARINLALSFAFRDVLQARHGTITFCILDECLDTGLGAVGVQLAADMIKSIATNDKLSMFVITHKDEIASTFSRQLKVELRNGFSNIV